MKIPVVEHIYSHPCGWIMDAYAESLGATVLVMDGGIGGIGVKMVVKCRGIALKGSFECIAICLV